MGEVIVRMPIAVRCRSCLEPIAVAQLEATLPPSAVLSVPFDEISNHCHPKDAHHG